MKCFDLSINHRFGLILIMLLCFTISLSASEGGYAMTGLGKSITGSVSGNMVSMYWDGVMSMKSNVSLLHEMDGLQAGIGFELSQYVGLNSILAIGKGINAYNRHFGTGLMINRIDVQGLAFMTIDDTMNGLGYSGFVRSGETKFSITEVNICFSGAERKLGYGINGKISYGDAERKTFMSYGGDIGARYIVIENMGKSIDSLGIVISIKDIVGNRIFWSDGEREKSSMLLDVSAGCMINVELGILKEFSKRIKMEIGTGMEDLNISSILPKAGMTIELISTDKGSFEKQKLMGIIGYDGRRIRGGLKLQIGELMIGFTSGYSFGSLESFISENINIEIIKSF